MSPVEELLHKLVRPPVIVFAAATEQEASRISALLDSFHCHAIATCSVAEAADTVRGRSIDLLLVDNRIDCDSESRLLAVALMENPSMPVVVFTGYGDDDDELPAKTANHGFVGLFPKPSTSRDFEQLFRSLKLKVRQCPSTVSSPPSAFSDVKV